MVPNMAGWCEAMEMHLKALSFKFVGQDNLRRRFSNTFRWYTAMLDSVQLVLRRVIDDKCDDVLRSPASDRVDLPLPSSSPTSSLPSSPVPSSSRSLEDRDSLSSQSASPTLTQPELEVLPTSAIHSPSSSLPPFPPESSLPPCPSSPVRQTSIDDNSLPRCTRPSLYLRRCCGMCFGGDHCHDESYLADFIASIDACFTQKRNKNARNADYRDTKRRYSDTCFLSEQEVKDMETYVESIRARPAPTHSQANADDHVEVGMDIPASVLDECGNSFLATDKKREKASTQFFADTGVMSMICRHDRVLFAVNMTHRRERQHYALALIKCFMSEIPDDMTLGLLYDIACQLKRSMFKHGFLSELSPRIIFGISVFHAYGHAWPCQVIYHPRKCLGFGLSDGEGCERFWSSIRKLIPTLRISGRLYTLDLHIQYLTDKAHTLSGAWLARRWASCQTRKANIAKSLHEMKRSIPFLREQWALQVTAQTQPMPRCSKHKGRQAVLAVLALDSSISSEQGLAKKLDTLMERGAGDFLEISEQMTEVNKCLQRLHDVRRAKLNALGMSDTNDLSCLQNNTFLCQWTWYP
ncbi:hypothetical protein HWV62_1146 [Athelia sp. TMB]|nr:hypothetical protein HWV62_1146 [Athelia sp. TMB]